MRQIELRGKGGKVVTLVDDEDYELVSDHPCWAQRGGSGLVYARISVNGKVTELARFILGLPAGDKRLAEHTNRDGLDNRRHNLRIATHAQNMRNRRAFGSSGYKGVYRDPSGRGRPRWRAQLRLGKQCFRSTHYAPLDAALAYDSLARTHFGEFARLNFPCEGEQGA